MREAESSVVRALGRDPEAMLRHELATSITGYASILDGRVIAVGGIKCRHMLADEAYVWICCSDLVNRRPLAFVRTALEAFALAKQYYRSIYGLLVTDFEHSVRWVSWLGFTVEPPVNGVALFWWGRRPDVDLSRYNGH